MRSRNLKPGYFKNEELGTLPFEHRILFAGLWCFSDREGFFENRPLKIAAEIFPYDRQLTPKKISEMLCNLMSRHVITLNDTHGYIPNFLNHNNPHPHEAKSVVPEEIKKTLKNQCNDTSVTSQLQVGLNPVSCILYPDIRNPESCIPPKELKPLSAQNADGELFNQFWQQYPRHEKKKNALEAFKRINLKNGTFEKITEALAKQKMSEQWTKDGGKFIPHPTTWLNGRRWEDEIKESDGLNQTQRAILACERRDRENGK
jgi:hypothetical protein